MNLARSSIQVFLARVAGSLISFLGITFFARELGASQIGVFFLFQAVLGMVTIPADFGVRSAITKRISEGESPGSFLSTSIILKVLLLIPFVGGILLLRKPINNYLGADLALYLVLLLVLQESANITIQVLKGELRVGEIAGPTLARKVVYVCIAAILVHRGFGVEGIISGVAAGLIVMLLWGASKSLTPFGSPSIKQARSLLDFSKYSFISSIGGYFYNWMDVAIIGFFLTQSSVGVYEISWRITAVIMLFSRSIAITIFPQVSQWNSKDATERIESILPKAMAPALFISIPAFLGVVLFSREILKYVFGAEYTVGWLVLIILMGEKVIQSVHIILGKSLQGINRPDLAAKAGVVSMVLNLVLNVVLVLEYGIFGAAIATTFSFVVNSLLHGYYLSKFISIRFPYRKIAGCTVCSLGMTGALYAIKLVVPITSLSRLVLVILFGVAIYLGFSLFISSSRGIIVNNFKRAVS